MGAFVKFLPQHFCTDIFRENTSGGLGESSSEADLRTFVLYYVLWSSKPDLYLHFVSTTVTLSINRMRNSVLS